MLELMEDRLLLATFTVNTADDPIVPGAGVVSLRSAIAASNAAGSTGTPNIINFRITNPSGTVTITPISPLPTITTPVTIDATTEEGFGGTPVVQLSGTAAGSGANGFTVTAGNTTIRGFAINRFTAEGISLTSAGNNVIDGNYIGTNVTGTTAVGNGLDGILVSTGSNNNTIRNNLISGNLSNGIFLGGVDAGSTTGNIVVGNTIGLRSDGSNPLGNGGAGILLQNAANSTIGGTSGATRNVIAGNLGGVLALPGVDGSVIQGNYIGTDASGTRALGNGAATAARNGGIVLTGASNVRIGGTASGAGNVISGNAGFGILSQPFVTTGTTPTITSGSGITIQGNNIGVGPGGTGILGNAGGVVIYNTPNVTIGGTTSAAGNVIGNNATYGILASSSQFAASAVSNLVVQGNFIGTNRSAATDPTTAPVFGNGLAGVELIFVNGATIGAAVDSPNGGGGNVIANAFLPQNGTPGAITPGVDVRSGSGNAILSNSIYSNALGIYLNSLTAPGNNSQPAPILTSAVSSIDFSNTAISSSVFTGVLPNATVGDTYTLQFFTNLAADAAGNFEGQSYIGTASVTIGAGGTFTANLPVGFTAGTAVTATATDPNNNTSEFSGAVSGTGFGPLNRLPVLSVVSSATSVAAGQQVAFTFTITNDSQVVDTGVSFYAAIPVGTEFFSGVGSNLAFDPTVGALVPTAIPVVYNNGVANAAIGTIAAGQSATVTLILTTGGAAVPAFTITGGVTSVVPTITPGVAQTSATVSVSASDDLYAFVNGPLVPVQVGQNITYEVTVGNNGPSAATGVVLTNALPAGTRLVSATASNGTTPTLSGGSVIGNIGSLASGATVVVTIVVSTDGNTPLNPTDIASVTGDQPDSDPSNNAGAATTTIVPSSDVAINSEAAAPGSVQAGQLVTYTFNVANNGPSAATGVVLRDTLPAGSTFVSGSAAGGAVSFADGVVTAPVGTLAAGATSVVTVVVRIGSAGLVTDLAVITGDNLDPNLNNNTSSATVAVSPLTDLAVGLIPPPNPGTTGTPFVYTAVVTNTGPSAGTGTVFSDSLPAGATFISAVASNGAAGMLMGNNIVVPLGTVASGEVVTIAITILPTIPGTFTSTANVASAEPDANAGNNTSTAAFVAAAPVFFINFTSPTYVTTEISGSAPITLVRTGDLSSPVTVRLSTIPGGNAVAGVDYQPVSTIVTFQAGSATATASIPVLANPNDILDEFVNLQLDSPTGGAQLFGGGSQLNAVLRIVNTDPLLVGPTVIDFKLTGPQNSITSIEVDTTGKLNPATAGVAANYRIVAVGGGTGRNRLPAGTVVAVSAVSYNPATGAVTLTPATPLPANQLFQIVVNGSGPGGVTDLAGNPLNSVFNQTPGSDFVLTFQRGTTITYSDENGRRVTLRLAGAGTLDINRAPNGVLQRLQVVGANRGTSLSGSVAGAPPRRTTIGSVIGLRRFGTVRTSLPSPPFFVTNTIYPNLQSLNNGDAVDTLLRPAQGNKKAAVSAKALTTTGAAHPKAGAAHAAKAGHKPAR